MPNTPWRLAGPTVSVDVARRIHDVRHEMNKLVLESLGHAELVASLRAAGGAMEECTRLAMRDVDRTTQSTKRPAVPKRKGKATRRRTRQEMANVAPLGFWYQAAKRKREAANAENVSRKK